MRVSCMVLMGVVTAWSLMAQSQETPEAEEESIPSATGEAIDGDETAPAAVEGESSLSAAEAAWAAAETQPGPETTHPPPDALPDPCDGVTCSGHGDCEIERGRAVCSCDWRYRADASMLECTPYSEPDYSETVISARPKSSDVQRSRTAGAAMVGVGSFFLAGAMVLAVGALVADDSESIDVCDEYGDCRSYETTAASNENLVLGLAVGAFFSLGAGVGLLVPGIIRLRRARRMSATRRNLDNSQIIALRISPEIHPRSGGGGLRLSLGF